MDDDVSVHAAHVSYHIRVTWQLKAVRQMAGFLECLTYP